MILYISIYICYQARIDSKEDVVVGVNKYKLAQEAPIDVLSIDNKAVRDSQIERLNKLKAARDDKKVAEALKKISDAAGAASIAGNGKHDSNLLNLAVVAARERATLGEISAALETVWGRHVATSQVVQGAYSATYSGASNESEIEYQSILKQVDEFASKEGRRPRLLVAKMGQDGHDRGAKVIASGFSDLGYDVDVGPLFSTPEEVARQAIDADVHVVGVSSQAAGHRTLLPNLINELKKQNGSHIKVICGGVIPAQDYQYLYDEGVLAIFGPGTKITSAAADVLRAISKD